MQDIKRTRVDLERKAERQYQEMNDMAEAYLSESDKKEVSVGRNDQTGERDMPYSQVLDWQSDVKAMSESIEKTAFNALLKDAMKDGVLTNGDYNQISNSYYKLKEQQATKTLVENTK